MDSAAPHTAIVSLGSNLEPRARYLERALAALSALPSTRLVKASGVRETEPVGVPAEFAALRFLNQIAVFETALDAREFSRRMHAVEDALGRVRTVRNGPRTVDVDLIDFDGIVLDDPELTLPHPRALERDFVMRPMRELGLFPPWARLPRGLIEVSNLCAKNCHYCGIRRGAGSVVRYHLTEAETLAAADEAVRRGYPAVALQAGELESEANTAFYEGVLRKLPKTLEVTLSLGEQSEEVYRRWKTAAEDRVLRYLLRIETSNRELYAKIHPADHSFDRRLECIRTLKRLGYVTGSGVMIGLPGQTEADLERDLEFFVSEKLDMVGMGPYIEEPGTPLAEESERLRTSGGARWWSRAERFEKALWMIRETRRRLPMINIVAATALEALDPEGREKGFAAGANVYMPNLTPERYRVNYTLYPKKNIV